MNKVGKRRAYVFGCGEVFLSKQEDILKDYEVVGFFDNNRNTFIKKINYLLNGQKEEELKYHFDNIRNLSKLYYSGDTRSLNEIKKDINKS